MRAHPNLGIAAEACRRYGPLLISAAEGDKRVAVQEVCDYIKSLNLPGQWILSHFVIQRLNF